MHTFHVYMIVIFALFANGCTCDMIFILPQIEFENGFSVEGEYQVLGDGQLALEFELGPEMDSEQQDLSAPAFANFEFEGESARFIGVTTNTTWETITVKRDGEIVGSTELNWGKCGTRNLREPTCSNPCNATAQLGD